MSKFTFLIALLVVVCGVIQTRADVEDAWHQYLVKLYRLMKENAIQYNVVSNFKERVPVGNQDQS
jgi:hypothetical protein